MTDHSWTAPLDGLDGRTLLHFLAAIGTLRALDAHTNGTPRLSWTPADTPIFHAQLDRPPGDPAPLLEALDDSLQRHPAGTTDGATRLSLSNPNKTAKKSTKKGFRDLATIDDPAEFHAHNPSVAVGTTSRVGGDEPTIRPARWARNQEGKVAFCLWDQAHEAATILGNDKTWRNEPSLQNRWAELVGARNPQPPSQWKHTSRTKTTPKQSGGSLLWLQPQSTPYSSGIRKEAPSTDPASPGTEWSSAVAPALVWAASLGIGTLIAQGAKMPGEHLETNVARWATWTQPLSLRSIRTLLWHPALDKPRNPAAAALLHQPLGKGIHAAHLTPGAGTSPTIAPTR